VTLYTTLLGGGAGAGFPEGRNAYLSTLWEQYARFKPDIRYNYVYYYEYDSSSDNNHLHKVFPGKNLRQIAEQMAGAYELNLSLFESPEEVGKTVNLRPENLRLAMQVSYKGRTTFLRTFDDPPFWPDEQQIGAAFKRLLQAQMPKVYYVTGNLERSIYKRGEREFRLHSIDKLWRMALVNQGFDADTVSLDARDIPDDASIVVLADPKTSLSATTQRKIQEYVDKGGNLLVLGEPGKQAMLNPLLQPWGVQLMNGELVEPTKDEMPHMVRPYATDAVFDLAEEKVFLDYKKVRALHDYDDSLFWLMPGVTALSYTPGGAFTVKPLMMTVGERTWLKAGTLVVDSADILYSPQEGDVKVSFPTALALTREINGREQRIIICGDADCLSNLRGGGGQVSRGIFSWLDDNKFPIYTPRPDPEDNKLIIGPGTAKVLKIVYVWILPALVLLMGTVLLIRRKRK